MFVITQQYFDKKRAMAAGIAVSGFSIGTLVAGPFIHFLMDIYGWRGTLFIFGGIFLHVMPCALLYRPLNKKIHKTKLQNLNSEQAAVSPAKVLNS